MKYLIAILFVAAPLACTGCNKRSTADTSSTTTSPVVAAAPSQEERITSLEEYRKKNDLLWAAQNQYDTEEPDRILQAIESRLGGSSSSGKAAGLPTGRIGTPARSRPTPPAGGTVPPTPPTPPAAPAPLENGTEPVPEKYRSAYNALAKGHEDILKKEDKILEELGKVLTGVTSNGDKIKDLGNRVKAIENGLRSPPEPEK